MVMFEVTGKVAGQPGPLLVRHAFADARGDVPNGIRWSGHSAPVSTDREFFHCLTDEIRRGQPIRPGKCFDSELEGFIHRNGIFGRNGGSHTPIIRRFEVCDKVLTPVDRA